jgi:hypothetical protein
MQKDILIAVGVPVLLFAGLCGWIVTGVARNRNSEPELGVVQAVEAVILTPPGPLRTYLSLVIVRGVQVRIYVSSVCVPEVGDSVIVQPRQRRAVLVCPPAGIRGR